MPPPPPSSSSDGGYLGIPAMSSRLKALEEKIVSQIGPLNSAPTNRITSRTPNAQPRQLPSSNKNYYCLCFKHLFYYHL